MRRKVLIAEQTDTLRSIAETVLRQNGYDVISVTAAEKAREVLELSQPDLIIVGADLVAPDGTPYYERIRQDARAGSIPMLLFEPAGETEVVFPDEGLIPRPFDPRDLMQKVSGVLGGRQSGAESAAGSPDGSTADDEFLDAALGLDDLDVTDSEVMDRTAIGQRSKSDTAREKLIGLDTGSMPTDENETGANTVESLIIDEGSSQIKHRTLGRTAPAPDASGAIEIMTDQYGLTESGSKPENEDAAHDYDWFVDAMKGDGDPASPSGQTDSGSLTITDPAASVDPKTPGPAPSGGVEQFIDEFKKEMEQVRAEEGPQTGPEGPVPTPVDTGEELAWEEKAEQIGPAQIDLFIREFGRALGEKVAKIMASRIDPEKLLRMIKNEILEQQKKST